MENLLLIYLLKLGYKEEVAELFEKSWIIMFKLIKLNEFSLKLLDHNLIV